jgi:hypothetical protein
MLVKSGKQKQKAKSRMQKVKSVVTVKKPVRLKQAGPG